jgi:hypothetical protein
MAASAPVPDFNQDAVDGHCQLGREGSFWFDVVGCRLRGFRPLSQSARWRRIANAEVDDSSLSASAVLVGRGSGRRREGRGTVALDQQI